jgi:hypothetical protein
MEHEEALQPPPAGDHVCGGRSGHEKWPVGTAPWVQMCWAFRSLSCAPLWAKARHPKDAVAKLGVLLLSQVPPLW